MFFVLLVSFCFCHVRVGHPIQRLNRSRIDALGIWTRYVYRYIDCKTIAIWSIGLLYGDWTGTANSDFDFVCLVGLFSFALLSFWGLIHRFKKSDLLYIE